MKTTSLESQGNGPIHHLHVDLAELVLEELAAGRHHHLVHVDVVVLEVSKEVRPGGLEDEKGREGQEGQEGGQGQGQEGGQGHLHLADDIQVHKAGLEPQLLELLAQHPAVVLQQSREL